MASSPSRRRNSTAKYPRTARVNEVFREVIATDLERREGDDPRLELVTVTAVRTDTDLRRATVFFSALGTAVEPEEVAEALSERRVGLQAAIGREVRLKNTPQLSFEPDSGIIEGQRVENILRQLPPIAPSESSDKTSDD